MAEKEFSQSCQIIGQGKVQYINPKRALSTNHRTGAAAGTGNDFVGWLRDGNRSWRKAHSEEWAVMELLGRGRQEGSVPSS